MNSQRAAAGRANVGTDNPTDDVLLSRVRDSGDQEAFACLYQRHGLAARRFARSLCGNDADADDITAEVFTSLFASLRRGHGPSQLALPYVLASVRNRHWRTAGRRARETALLRTESVGSASCESASIVESDVVRAALKTLPADVQVLLWRTEVNDETRDDASERRGASAHNVAVRRHRARRALGTAYLAQHAAPAGGLAGLHPECRSTLSQLAPLIRNTIGVRQRQRLEAHLADCEQCTQARRRLERINTRLRSHHTLPWSTWWAGLTSTLTAQASAFLGTSAMTLTSSSALAMAVLVPSPTMLANPDQTESRSAVAASTAHDEVATREVASSEPFRFDGTALALSVDPPESRRVDVPLGSVVTATTNADVPPGATPREGVAQDATRPLAPAAASPGQAPVPIAPSATEPDRGNAGGDGKRRGATDSGKSPDTGIGEDQGTPAPHATSQGAANANNARAQGNGAATGHANANSAKAQGNGAANGNERASGNGGNQGAANGHDSGSSPKAQGNGAANGQDTGTNGASNGNEKAQGNAGNQGAANGQLVTTADDNGPGRTKGQDDKTSKGQELAKGPDGGVASGQQPDASEAARGNGVGDPSANAASDA
jgi:RNA polymerase sigma factor (sigma-70 family)